MHRTAPSTVAPGFSLSVAARALAGRISPARLPVLALLIAFGPPTVLLTTGCRQAETYSTGYLRAITPPAARSQSLLPRAREALRAGHRLESEGSEESVDCYYETAVYAFGAFTVASSVMGPDHPDVARARELYNEGLRDCLRSAQQFGRLDPRSHLIVNTPAGSQTVPILHRGFVWQSADFCRLADPTRLDRNPYQHGVSTLREGLGADVAVLRPNPGISASDRFLPRESAFNATALLRPDLDAWLGQEALKLPADVLEFHDPLRVTTVTSAGQTVSLAANFGAANALAHQVAAARGPFALAGFALPSTVLEKADIRMLEPYQPRKIPVLFIHGLLDDPFIFNDLMIALYRMPGFVDRYQIWVFRYATGVTFLRSAAQLRADLRDAAAGFDPAGRDPGFRNMVVIGYSMGGLLAKLQVTSSGDRLWAVAANRPLETLVTSERTRDFLRDVFYFEPSPMIRRVIFIATPHDGSPVANTFIGRLATRIVQRPSESTLAFAQIERDNPGAVRPFLQGRLPSSIDVLASGNPLLPAMRQLPLSPTVSLHTIAGHGIHSPDHARGDLVVPLSSAHLDEAVSEHWVPAIHTNIYYHPQTIAEVQRILTEHAALSSLPASWGARGSRQRW
jgi:pimeloyl-ACP methyl ester carboxylesterase